MEAHLAIFLEGPSADVADGQVRVELIPPQKSPAARAVVAALVGMAVHVTLQVGGVLKREFRNLPRYSRATSAKFNFQQATFHMLKMYFPVVLYLQNHSTLAIKSMALAQ